MREREQLIEVILHQMYLRKRRSMADVKYCTCLVKLQCLAHHLRETLYLAISAHCNDSGNIKYRFVIELSYKNIC